MNEKKFDIETNWFRNFDFDWKIEKNDFDDVKNRNFEKHRFENLNFWLRRLKIW